MLKVGLYISVFAFAVLLLGGGAVLTLSEGAGGKSIGYGFIIGGACLAIFTVLIAVRTWMRVEVSSVEQAERIIEKRRSARFDSATQPEVSVTEDTTMMRQEARAKRVRDAHRRGDSKS